MSYCIFIQSAGKITDFNWKRRGSEGCGVIAAPSATSIDAYRSLAFAPSGESICRVKLGADRFGVVARRIYVEGKRDANSRPIYLNICIEGLSEVESKAFEASYRREVSIMGVHTWPQISNYYRENGDDFDMDWEGLEESINQIIKSDVPDDMQFSKAFVYPLISCHPSRKRMAHTPKREDIATACMKMCLIVLPFFLVMYLLLSPGKNKRKKA